MTEDNSYEVRSDPSSAVIVQQLKNDDPPSQPIDVAAPETKDLAPPLKPNRHHRHPTPDIAAITKRYSTQLPSTEHHSRKCQICHHPDRTSIEEDFLLRCSAGSIVDEYEIPRMALYRHAYAFDLFTVRRESLRLGLDRIVERGAETFVTGDMVIRAIKAQACLTDDNRWEDPPKRVIFSSDPPKESLSGERIFRSGINDTGEANRCAESAATSSHELRITSRESPVLIDTLPIRNEA